MTSVASRGGAEALAQAAIRALREGLDTAPAWVVAAPGRVNLIGEHTDYSAGFVLPMAIERNVVIAAGPAPGNRLHLASATTGEFVEIPLDEPSRSGAPRWSSYVRGVLAGYQRRGARVPSMNAWLVSDVPMGSGLASSAALEVAMATLLEVASGTRLPPVEKARLCQRAEHEFAGVPCGLMDQLSATLGDENGPLLIDCQTEIVRSVPFPHASVRVVVANTNVPRSLGAGAYAQRYAECESAARCLGVGSLREATLPMVDAAAQALGPVLHRRARHVVTENARTLDAARALEERDLQRLGALFYESHASLRDDYEVSTPELDALVECAREIGEPGGVLGARMNGAGFGGCTVTLVHATHATALCEALQHRYEHRTGRVLDVFVSRPARGARVLDATSLG